mgnify:CR=1 FL=1
MKEFVKAFRAIDQTTKTLVKVKALSEFFETADPKDKMWAIALFSHKRPKRTVNTTLLRHWAAEIAQLPLWLFEESYHIVGDLAETIALILPPPENKLSLTLSEWINRIIDLKDESDEVKKEAVLNAWNGLEKDERFLFNKLITGGFRIGVSQKTVVKALAKATSIEENSISHRLMGNWSPIDTSYEELILSESPNEDISKPYPFYLAYALEQDLEELGNPNEWSAEYKWDGIRGQIILRDGEIFVWSRGEDLVTDKFPELGHLADKYPHDIVIDGEIIPIKEGKILSFNQLQTRIGRKNIAKKHLTEVPISVIAYDLLEYDGKDLRDETLQSRRDKLEKVVEEINSDRLVLSTEIKFDNWEELIPIRENSRAMDSEGLMLKKKDSIYEVGRKKGNWWKWKVDPLTIDGVMIYAQRGHGRRANLYTDFTFAVWDGEMLVPFTKAYSGLTDKEFNEVTRYVRKNTVERFGPVRSVKPDLVFELAFEGIAKSTRHKSGVSLRFPRIKRWRKDKPAKEANTLEDLQKILEVYQ